MSRHAWWCTVVCGVLLGLGGCSKAMDGDFVGGTSSSYDSELALSEDISGADTAGEATTAGIPSGTSPAAEAATRLERKIIYNATLDLVVEDFADVAAQVAQLVQKYGAFVAKSSVDTASGRPRSGSWTIRVPVARYEEFLNAVGQVGELQRRTQDSREVTAEYYDLETRIRNKRLEETRLLEHLEKSTGKLEDILAVEKELARVRTEIEQMQGQLRVLQDLTALSTVVLNVSELRGFVPLESPSFGTQIGRTWRGSLAALLGAGKQAVLAAIACVPWLAVLVPLVLLGWIIRRRRRGG